LKYRPKTQTSAVFFDVSLIIMYRWMSLRRMITICRWVPRTFDGVTVGDYLLDYGVADVVQIQHLRVIFDGAGRAADCLQSVHGGGR